MNFWKQAAIAKVFGIIGAILFLGLQSFILQEETEINKHILQILDGIQKIYEATKK
jgi:tRNA G37 N-methylase Trm5